MFTTVEAGSVEELFDVLAEAYRAVEATGPARILMSLKTDQRLDRNATMDDKIRRVTGPDQASM